MNLVTNNPYRVAGIISNASEKEIERQKAKINAYARVGKKAPTSFDLSALPSISSTEEAINQAFSNLEQNKDKVRHALFWFVNANSIDQTALEYIKKGNEEKAVQIWEKITANKVINSNNYSAFNNLSTYKLSNGDKLEIKEGIAMKISLVQSDQFSDFVHLVADETFTIDQEVQIKELIDQVIEDLNDRYSTSEIFNFFDDSGDKAKKLLTKKFAKRPIEKIEVLIDRTKKKRKESKNRAYDNGKELYYDTKEDLKKLQSLLGKENLRYKSIADQLAKELLQCSIDYFNYHQDKNDSDQFVDKSLSLAQYAKMVAERDLTKERIADNIESISSWKEKELNQAIEVLKSVQTAFENQKAKIESEVYSMRLAPNQSINWNKVDKLVNKSLNWDKVVGLVKDVIPKENIEKIKASTDKASVEKYKELVNWLISKLSFTQINRVRYMCYWKTEDTSSNILFTLNSLPIWFKWLAGIAIFLGVIGLIWGGEAVAFVFMIAIGIGFFYLLSMANNQ